MKNKHLVFLFFVTVAVGLLIRQAPWRKVSFFQTDLIGVDTAAATQISIFAPGRSELLIERTENGWAATQELHSVIVPPDQIAAMLTALAHVRSLRIVKTERPDTLGLSDSAIVRIAVFRDRKNLEHFGIGNEITENGQPATFIRLDAHGGFYLVEGRLRGVFYKEIGDFRSRSVARFDPAAVTQVAFRWPEDSIREEFALQKNDSTGYWQAPGAPAPGIPDDTLQNWLQQFNRLNDSPFADQFDETRERKTFKRMVTLRFGDSDSLVVRLFYAKPPELPEEVAVLKAGQLPSYIVHSSQNPLNYFAPPDTALLRSIFFNEMTFPDARKQ